MAIRTAFAPTFGAPKSRRAASPRRSRPIRLEALESRQLLSTIPVTNLDDSGAGSLRQAIVLSNRSPGPDRIDVEVSGTIRLGSTPLPAIRQAVTFQGGGARAAAVDFGGAEGFRLAPGGSIDDEGGLGMANIGAPGSTLRASRFEGAGLGQAHHLKSLGNGSPSVTYYDSSLVTLQPVTGWQGIRSSWTPGTSMLTGTSGTEGLYFVGSITGQGTSFSVNYPGSATSSVYGPDAIGPNTIRLVGSYKDADASTAAVAVHGFLYQGTTGGLTDASNYRTIDYPGAQFNYVHSTMGGLAVGNYDSLEAAGVPIGSGHAYIYSVATGRFVPVAYPGSTSDTAYGIWYNGGTSYTICGGFSTLSVNNMLDQTAPIGQAYLVDYNSATGKFSNWKAFSYPTPSTGTSYITHFEGISGGPNGVYTLAADSIQTGAAHLAQGSFVTVKRNPDGSFGKASWVDLNYPDSRGLSSANSVSGNALVGLLITGSGTSSFQATVNPAT